MSERGFSLVETLVAVALLAFLSTGILTAFSSQAASSGRNERRLAATAAAEQVLEFYRMDDPELMPTSGSVGPVVVAANTQEFEVFTLFCTRPTFCTDTARQLVVEVYSGPTKVYDVETVFTQVR